MLLAVSDAGKEHVELPIVPEGVPVGERIKFGSLDAPQAEPFAPNKLQKKKVFEAVVPDLATSASKVLQYKNLAMLTSGAEVTTATLASGSVG